MSVGAMEDRGQESQDAKSLEPDLTRKTLTFWSVCECVDQCMTECIYTWASVHVRACSLWTGWLLLTMKATGIVYCSVARDSSFESVLVTFWKQLLASDAQTLLMTLFYDPVENCCWCLFIGTLCFFNVDIWDLEVFRRSYMILCHLKSPIDDSRGTEWRFFL